MKFSRLDYWSGYPLPSPGDLPNPGNEPRSPTLLVDSLLFESPGKLLGTPIKWPWGLQYKPMRCYVTLGMRAKSLRQPYGVSTFCSLPGMLLLLEKPRGDQGAEGRPTQSLENKYVKCTDFPSSLQLWKHSHYPDMDKQVVSLTVKCFQIVPHLPHSLVSSIKMLISHPHIELTAICLLVWISWFPSFFWDTPLETRILIRVRRPLFWLQDPCKGAQAGGVDASEGAKLLGESVSTQQAGRSNLQVSLGLEEGCGR